MPDNPPKPPNLEDLDAKQLARALACASGYHEPLIADTNSFSKRPVWFSVDSYGGLHGTIMGSLCKHCRVFYCRRKDEGWE